MTSDILGLFLQQGSSEDPDTEASQDVGGLKNARLLHKAIVIETLCDPATRKDPPSTLVNTPEMKTKYGDAPRNSLVCRVTTDDNPRALKGDIVCFPFFSSHMALPVKAGEMVWVIGENLFGDIRGTPAYWVSRMPLGLATEDLNFGSFSRVITSHTTGSEEPGENRILETPNFPDSVGSIIQGGADAIKSLVTGTIESDQIALEPVPRFTKRPGDLVIQGSNNTCIAMGTDRGFDLDDRPTDKEKSNTSEEKIRDKSGAIDIVAGRGRYFDTDDEEIKKPRKKSNKAGAKNSTAPFIVKNDLGKFETDKDPQQCQDRDNELMNADHGAPPDVGNDKTNPSEGDPDFLMDASRIYISESTDVDKRLGLAKIKAAGFSENTGKEIAATLPSVAVKSDHVRIVARRIPVAGTTDEKLAPKASDAGATNGTIRIVKEGKADEDLAVIYIESDGTIQISGKKIFIGRKKGDGGDVRPADSKCNLKGDGDSEPYMRFSDFEIWVESFIDALDKSFENVESHFQDLGAKHDAVAAGVASGGICKPYEPNKAMGAAATGQFPANATTYAWASQGKTDVAKHRKDQTLTNNIASKRIWGE